MKIKFQFNRIIEAINKNLIEPQKQLEIRLDRLLDPHQRGMVVAKGMERPFTAEFWNMFINSKNTVLQCDSKYQALKVMQHSFSITNSVKIIDTKEKYVMLEQQRVSELLIIHWINFKGWTTTNFIRYSINSGAMKFYQPNKLNKSQTNHNNEQ